MTACSAPGAALYAGLALRRLAAASADDSTEDSAGRS